MMSACFLTIGQSSQFSPVQSMYSCLQLRNSCFGEILRENYAKLLFRNIIGVHFTTKKNFKKLKYGDEKLK